ncbi:MAG TPA: hypothetical protein VMZ24_05865 [Patescibacteria group bacterium]|nr:hypothetical protein [Patescibacteria group bacterium]
MTFLPSDFPRLRLRLNAERLEVIDSRSCGTLDDRWWRFCPQHHEQAEDRSREEASLKLSGQGTTNWISTGHASLVHCSEL